MNNIFHHTALVELIMPGIQIRTIKMDIYKMKGEQCCQV